MKYKTGDKVKILKGRDETDEGLIGKLVGVNYLGELIVKLPEGTLVFASKISIIKRKKYVHTQQYLEKKANSFYDESNTEALKKESEERTEVLRKIVEERARKFKQEGIGIAKKIKDGLGPLPSTPKQECKHKWQYSFLNSGKSGINALDKKRICVNCGKIETYINTPIPPPVGSKSLLGWFDKWH